MADGSRSLSSKGRICIVEDHEEMALILSYNLQRRGFEVDVMTRGDLAETLLSRSTYDLLVLDWMVPGLFGIELLRRLRRTGVARLTPVIMLSALSSKADIARALAVGADAYIKKPFSVGQLMDRIDALIACACRRDAMAKVP